MVGEFEFGDFTQTAAFYQFRAPYSFEVMRCLARYIADGCSDVRVADIGAGTGSLVRLLAQLGMTGYAIEPNGAMVTEGRRQCADIGEFVWIQAAGEQTGLPDYSVDWICVGSAFHWMKREAALNEFRRILRPRGHLSILYKLKDFARDPFQRQVEEKITSMVPNIRRARVPILRTMEILENSLLADGNFRHCLFMEAAQCDRYPRDLYLKAWQTAHDIRSQVTPETWADILAAITAIVGDRREIETIHSTTAWTVRKVSS